MLQSLLRTADQLKIKGLCESPDNNNKEHFVKSSRKSTTPKQFKLQQDNNRKYKYKRYNHRNNNKERDKETTDEENDMPVVSDEHNKRKRFEPEQTKPLNMTSHGIITGQVLISIVYSVGQFEINDCCSFLDDFLTIRCRYG